MLDTATTGRRRHTRGGPGERGALAEALARPWRRRGAGGSDAIFARDSAGIGGGIAALVALTYAGLCMRTAALPAPAISSPDLGTRPVPHALPLPIRRYLERIGGVEVPITTTVMTLTHLAAPRSSCRRAGILANHETAQG